MSPVGPKWRHESSVTASASRGALASSGTAGGQSAPSARRAAGRPAETNARSSQGRGDLPMPKLLCEVVDRRPGGDQVRGVCVPHVVEPEMWKSRCPQDRLEESPELSWRHGLSGPRPEYPRRERGLGGDHRLRFERPEGRGAASPERGCPSRRSHQEEVSLHRQESFNQSYLGNDRWRPIAPRPLPPGRRCNSWNDVDIPTTDRLLHLLSNFPPAKDFISPARAGILAAISYLAVVRTCRGHVARGTRVRRRRS